MKKLILLSAVFLITFCLGADDIGLILYQNVKTGKEPDSAFNYSASLFPRVSLFYEDKSDLFFSLGLTAGYDGRDVYFLHEILRTELSVYFDRAKFSAGRMQYASPFEYAADSLFDGLMFSYYSAAGTINAGAWYTGFLYKRRANIIMTGEDYEAYGAAVDYKNLSATYFPSRRAAAALDWEHPAVADLVRTKLGVIAQIDLNGRDNPLNSEYITARMGIPVKSVLFELGGAFQLTQRKDSFTTAAAAELGISWVLPSKIPGRLSFSGYFTSGNKKNDSDFLSAFIPINTKSFGNLLQIENSGFSAVSLDYTTRLHKTFSLSLSSSLIFKSLSGTYAGPSITEHDEFVLGNEFYASLVWSPASDLQFNLGSGIGIFNPASKDLQWHVRFTVVNSLY